MKNAIFDKTWVEFKRGDELPQGVPIRFASVAALPCFGGNRKFYKVFDSQEALMSDKSSPIVGA